VRIRNQINTISETTAFKDMATCANLFSIVNDQATGVHLSAAQHRTPY
jgi:hypothetical protein